MARLAGSPVPVPTTFSSTSGTCALKPGPRAARAPASAWRASLWIDAQPIAGHAHPHGAGRARRVAVHDEQRSAESHVVTPTVAEEQRLFEIALECRARLAEGEIGRAQDDHDRSARVARVR